LKPADPQAVRQRFLELVIRATARAAREEREHLERLRPAPVPRSRAQEAALTAARARWRRGP
jgi:hypothetical protein